MSVNKKFYDDYVPIDRSFSVVATDNVTADEVPANESQPCEYEEDKVNLDLLDVHRLTSELISKYNKNNDVGVITSFFRSCRNENQKKMLDSLLTLVSTIREHSKSLFDYKVQLIAQHHTFQLVVQGKVEEAQYAIDRMREEYVTYLHSQNAGRERTDLETERLRKEMELLGARVAMAHAEADLVKRKGEILDTIREQIDFKAMPPLMQAIILMKAIHPAANVDVDAVLKDKVLAAQLEKMAAEVEQMNAKTAQERVKAQYDEWKAKEEMRGAAGV